jgi:hypothetical protein
MNLAHFSALFLPIGLILTAVGLVYVSRALGHLVELVKLQTAELERLARLLERREAERPVSLDGPPQGRN